MKSHKNVSDKLLALQPKNEQTIIIIEDQQSPSSQASECNASMASCSQMCISTTKNQHVFNLISPSSIPNPSPSVSTKPLTLLQDSFATYNPYVSPITGHLSYSTPHYLSDVKDFQNLLSIPISIQDNHINNICSQSKNFNQNAEKKSENPSILDRSFYNNEQSISLIQNDGDVHNFQNGTFQDCIQDQCVNVDEQSNKNYGTKSIEQQNSKIALTKNEKCNVKSSVEITNIDFRSTVPNNDIFLSKTFSNNYRSANNMSAVKIVHSQNYDMNDTNFAQTLEPNSQEQKYTIQQKNIKMNTSQQMFTSKNVSDSIDKSKAFNIKDIEQKSDKFFKTNVDSSNIIWNFQNKSNDISILEKSVLENLESKNWNTPIILKPNVTPAITNNIKNNMETGDSEPSKCTFIPSMNNDKMLLTFPQKLQNLNNTVLIKSKEDISNINDTQIYSKKLKEHLLSENVKENHVVALKRLHHENIDENDFENLITENQIYGNKIVIKEKSQFVVSNEKSNKHFKTNSKNNTISEYKMNSEFGFQSNFPNINNVLQNHIKLPNILDEKSSVIQRLKDNIFGNHTNENILNPVFQTNTNHVHLSDQSFKTINPFTQSLSYVKTNIVETPTSNNVLQTLLNKPTIKLHEQIAVNLPTKSIKDHVLYQMPYLIEGDESANMFLDKPHSNSEFAMLLSKVNDEWKTINTNQNLKMNENFKQSHNNTIHKSEDIVFSSIDLAEKRRRKRLENKRSSVSKSEKPNVPKTPKTNTEDMHEFRLSYKQYQMYVGIVGEKYFEDSTSEDSTSSESEGEDTFLDDIHRLTLDTSIPPNYDKKKLNFLNVFGLTTIAKRNEKELEKVEKSIKLDAITTALVSVTESIQAISQSEKMFSLDMPKVTLDNQNSKIDEQALFLNSLRLGSVTETFKIEHENKWQYILKERKRRNGTSPLLQYFEKLSEAQSNHKTHSTSKNETINIHTKDQLDIMTEIKKSVTENNNLIKKAIDNILTPGKNESSEHLIPELAEKNFSQITKLSNMANKSLKMFGKQHCVNNEQSEAILGLHEKVNDFNPKFDNTRGQVTPKLNIPNVPKVISLKTLQDSNIMDISPATSMDEPRSSAAGAFDGDDTNNPIVIMIASTNEANSNIDIKQNIHIEKEYKWPGIEVIIEAYGKYNEDSKAERNVLIHENTRLLREVMSLQTEATNLTNELQQLMNKQQTYEEQQANIQTSLDIIHNCIKQLVV